MYKHGQRFDQRNPSPVYLEDIPCAGGAVDEEDEVTEKVERKREPVDKQEKRKSDFGDWLFWFFGGF